ncbi:MAG: 1,4-alpha-glucan branching protein GlgB [Oscillospiraceae bacterium]
MDEQAVRRKFYDGTLTEGDQFFGAHPATEAGETGWRFRVWAPRATAVSVVGDWCDWTAGCCPMTRRGEIWETFVPGLQQYDAYKFAVTGKDGVTHCKCDPYGFHTETRPGTASKLYDLSGYVWGDGGFHRPPVYHAPMNTYELHLGSWKRRENGDFIDYRDLAREIAAYVSDMGYTDVELLPVTEHPLDASWGYQCTGYFAPTSRFGTPDDFKFFVDTLHQAGIGVILDWVPAHFCKDEPGLYEFDGSCCYEYSDPKKWEHAGWGTRVFDYGKPEVISFLLSSAVFWLREYHIDGLRVDAVASMLYLDYDRQGGDWTRNRDGGRENLEAIAFLQRLNAAACAAKADVLMIAEESTAWPQVTKPAAVGGLGFHLKWNMGWMNDMCHYLKLNPFFRKDNHKDVTFSMVYAFSENFVLPMSHDEVVHLKGSITGKMPGDYPEQLQSLRGFYAFQLAHPGKKLMFMGEELGQLHEWDFNGELDWKLLENPENQKTQTFFRDINHFYLSQPALWEIDFDWAGFEWLVADDNRNNVVVFLRRDEAGEDLICAVNFSPLCYEHYRFGTPPRNRYSEVFNTDAPDYGGGGRGNPQPVPVERIPSHGKEQSIAICIPPLGAVFLRGEGTLPPPKAAVKRKAAAKKPRKPRKVTPK